MKAKRLLILIPICSILSVTAMNQTLADNSDFQIGMINSAELSVVGFDEDIAAQAGNRIVIRNGYKILVSNLTGNEISRIRIRSFPRLIDLKPLNFVSGNCGTSYFYIQNIGGGRYQFSTGFDLTTGKARDFSWDLSISSQWSFPNGGSYNFQWSDRGPLILTTHWTSGWKVDQTTAPSGSLHLGIVVKGVVYRSDGAICTSGYPNASVRVF